MDLTPLLDARGAAIVLGGTVVATTLGSGRRELIAALRAIGHIFLRPFSYRKARAEIARDVERIRKDGFLRAQPCHSSDSEISAATEAMINQRSLGALVDEHKRLKKQRSEQRNKALGPVRLSAEMAPVFGMAGTLLSLSQIQYDSAESATLMASVATAIASTLYGLMLAHLFCNPLARMIERRGEREDADRQMLTDWLAGQLGESLPQVAARSPRLERVK